GYLQQAAGMSGVGAAQPYLNTAGQTATTNIGQYMNPYTQNVTDQIASLGARNLSENLLPQVSDQFIRAGQFGSSGMGTFGGRALRDTQEAILNQQNQALQSGYTQALGASQTDLARQAQLATTAGQLTQAGQQNLGTIGTQTASTAQSEAARQQAAQQQVADLARMQQGLTTADAAALESVGSAQQQQQQRGLDVAYQDYQNQIQYPQTQINNMSTTLRGLPPTAVPTTGTTSGYTTTFAPSPLSGIAAAYGTYKGLTSPGGVFAKGGLAQGYAEGGAVTGGNDDDLHASVMADYGQYFNTGGEAQGYARGGMFRLVSKRASLRAGAERAGLVGVPVPLKDRSIDALTSELAMIQNAGNGTGIAVPGGDVAAYTQQLKDAIAANSASTTQTHYALSAPTVSAPTISAPAYITPTDGNIQPAPVGMPANLEELNAKYYQNGSPWGKSMASMAKMSHGGRVPGYADEGYVDTENPAGLVDGGQGFADQYAQGQQDYPAQQDAAVYQGQGPGPIIGREALNALVTKYGGLGDDAIKQLADINTQRTAARNDYNTQIAKLEAMQPQGPSESEKWFKFAAAYADPGKTGSFLEGTGHAASSMAEHIKANREYQQEFMKNRIMAGLKR
ncbi:MAG: hypothetical protein QX196_02580, partial [Methylococcaceae bacterium]